MSLLILIGSTIGFILAAFILYNFTKPSVEHIADYLLQKIIKRLFRKF